jgi:hypothetical protein
MGRKHTFTAMELLRLSQPSLMAQFLLFSMMEVQQPSLLIQMVQKRQVIVMVRQQPNRLLKMGQSLQQ